MAPTLVLLAQTRAGTGLATAGVLSALQALTAALSQPVLARAADRLGHRTLVTATTATSALAFLLLAITPTSEPLTGILVALTGLTAPPLQSLLRGRWHALVPNHAISSAHALDSSVSELLYIAAPLLTAATVYGISPASGYLLAAALAVAGTAILSITPPVPAIRGVSRRDPLGPLRSTDLRWIMAVHACLGAAVGAVALAGLLVATHSGRPSAAGDLPATYAVGAFLGGLLFGARRWPGPPATRLTMCFALMAVAWVPVALCSSPALAALAALAPGGAMTPALISGSDLRYERVTGAHTEASGWVIAATGVGRAVGVALASHWPTTWWPAIYAACALPAIALWLNRSRPRARASLSPVHTQAGPARRHPLNNTGGTMSQRQPLDTAPRCRVVTATEHYEGKQRTDFLSGISAESVGARALCMHLVVIPPAGVGEIHVHDGHETALYILSGEAATRWGAGLEHEAVAEAGEFLYIPAGVPHQAVNLSATDPVRAVLARTDPNEQESVRLVTVGDTRHPAADAAQAGER
jgi:uncharacterized RmlC-like cupin family protein/MFS family permease